MGQGVKTELKEGTLCGMEDRGRCTLWKGMKKQTRSKQMRSESPEKLPAFTGAARPPRWAGSYCHLTPLKDGVGDVKAVCHTEF